MGATFGASTKAVFASVVFAAEVTGQYQMVIPLMIGTAVAELVAEMFLGDRLMTEKLSHRGFRVDFDLHTGPLRMRTVHEVMREPEQSTVALADAGVPALGRLDFLATAFALMTRAGVDVLPVVEAGAVVGQIDRADIAAEQYRYRNVLETRQPGWVSTLAGRRTDRRPPPPARRPDRATVLHTSEPVATPRVPRSRRPRGRVRAGRRRSERAVGGPGDERHITHRPRE
jgi:hypothetical protein